MYSETSYDKRGVVILGHFALDRAFGTYHKLFLGVEETGPRRSSCFFST